ncbi:hypothetical protein ABZ815_52470 [Nonomuraea sp. NPDC047529]|uniref:hypothetical protein n=1 Tax=Nonomuraea sp. NPDC047529 TaxID=3155623 RepID=UPI0033CD2CB6
MVEIAPAWTATLKYYEEFLARHPGVARQQSWTIVLPAKDASQQAVAEIVSDGRPFRVERGHVGEYMDYHVADIVIENFGKALVLYETGSQLGHERVTERLSTLGDVYALYWDTHANNSLRLARAGEILLNLDILERRTWPSDSVNIMKELRIFEATDNVRAAAMAALDLRSGFRLTNEWLETTHDSVTFHWHP